MRLRFRSITYAVGGTPASLERHYRELRESMLRAGAHYGLQSSFPWRPPIDIHETPDAIVVKMEIAGVGEDDISITLYDNAFVVTGQRENDIRPEESVYYHEAQVRYGAFRADVLLPLAVDQDGVQATYEHGFLRVRLPKVEAPAATSIDASGGVGEKAMGDAEHGAKQAATRDHEGDHEGDHVREAGMPEGESETLKATAAAGNTRARRGASANEDAPGKAGRNRGSPV